VNNQPEVTMSKRAKERPEPKVLTTIRIDVLEDGNVSVAGFPNDPVYAALWLAGAQTAIARHFIHLAYQAEVAQATIGSAGMEVAG
jgi:hypothetical protein